jgi:hypothetical protein
MNTARGWGFPSWDVLKHPTTVGLPDVVVIDASDYPRAPEAVDSGRCGRQVTRFADHQLIVSGGDPAW